MSQAGILGFNPSAGSVTSITGNTGPAQTGAIHLVTANSTPIFAGAAGTITLDFGLRNLFLGVVPPLTTGDENVAVGFNAGLSITSSVANVLIGFNAGTNLVDGDSNVAIGDNALASATTGNSENVAIGANSLSNLTTGTTDNTAVGHSALIALTSGSSNIAIGFDAGNAYNGSESFNIVIGNTGQNSENGVTRIGSLGNQTTCFIAGIDAVDLSTANVVTEVSDQLGTATITGAGGIAINVSPNQIQVDGSGVASSISITGDSGGALVGNAFTFTGGTTNGTALFAGGGTTETLTFSDSDFNTVLGATAFKTTHTPAVAVANTGLGVSSLNAVTTASGNVAVGFNAGASLLGGINNTIVGTNAMGSSTSALTNTAFGASALTALLSGSGNTAVGTGAGSNYAGAESNNILVGSLGVLGESAKIRIGTNGTQTAAFIVGIDGVNVGSVAKVVTMASDQLGTATITGGTGISVSAGANTITVSATGTTTLTVTSVNNAASPYTVLTTDEFLAVNTSGGAVTIRLPNAPATGRVYYIKDSNGTAAASNITVTTVGGAVNIDGATSFVMNTAYESISVIFDGSAYEVF